ncbi:MAG: DUF4388 domain-containing protein [Candidatus Eisenbacteria bacterium]|nr:DUF4388 domain-containing protein [Candidatus Eisenbacteria bacterium]
MNPTSATAALSGKLEAIPLFDVCQFLLLNRRTGTLSVRHGDRTIRVFFEEGSILDIADEGLRTGEKLLLTAVQWTRGTFAFDPTPPGIERRITESTEAILLEAARTIDEQRAREGTQGEGPGQETVFRERQIFAGELAEAFKAAVSGGSRLHGREDPVESLLGELAADPREAGRPVRPAYLTFGPAGAIACRGGAAARSLSLIHI